MREPFVNDHELFLQLFERRPLPKLNQFHQAPIAFDRETLSSLHFTFGIAHYNQVSDASFIQEIGKSP